MNDEKIDVKPHSKNILEMLASGAVKLEDSRYTIYFPEFDSYCKGIGSYRSYLYNGATVDAFDGKDAPVDYEIMYHDDSHTRIDCLRLTLHEKWKMGDIFGNLPYGVIKKNIPGIGATTLALQQQRNTIIVVPTRALAYAKYITGYNEDKTQNKYLYVGSDMNECRRPTDEQIYEYLTRQVEQFTYKKIIVVADSLKRVMHYIDNLKAVYYTLSDLNKEHRVSLKKSWEIMVDEIDSYQSDGVFRPAMETVIDYYFSFPRERRCLVSATIRPFFNPQLQEEPVLELVYEESELRDVELIHTDNIHIEVCETIKGLRLKFPEDKVVIAYNSITSIQKIIAQLPGELQPECGIACSPDSRPKVGNLFMELDGSLVCPITFITCAYFVGVDIKERFHLISVSDIRQI